ncbi:MAG: hypothetical protein EOM64_09745 [Erysipelotrichia bacterium]|nr:hypothetical protein [Erysipelotrichia bacterium]
MADKKDFLGQLAQEADDKKHGKTASIDSVSNFVSRHQGAVANLDEDENEYPDAEPTVQKARQTISPVKPAPVYQYETEEEEDREDEDTEDTNEPSRGNSSAPDAFQEEKREKIEKKPIHFSKGAIIGGAVALALIGFLV